MDPEGVWWGGRGCSDRIEFVVADFVSNAFFVSSEVAIVMKLTQKLITLACATTVVTSASLRDEESSEFNTELEALGELSLEDLVMEAGNLTSIAPGFRPKIPTDPEVSDIECG